MKPPSFPVTQIAFDFPGIEGPLATRDGRIFAVAPRVAVILEIAPDGGDLRQAKGRPALRGSRLYDPPGYAASKVSVGETFPQLTENGAMGRPEFGSAEKGRKLYELITQCLVDFVKEFSNWKINRRSTAQ